MNNILQQLYVQGKDRMVPIYVNNKHIEVNNLENVTEEFLNENYSEYAVVIDKGNGNVYEQYEVGKWSGIKQISPEDIYSLNVIPNSINIVKIGGTADINVISTKSNNFIIANIESKPDWVTIENTQIIDNMIRYGLSIAANPASESRSGTIVIKQTESNKTVNVVVSQDGASTYVFSLSQSTLNVGPSATSYSIFVTSTKNGAPQRFSVDASSDWITATIMGGSSGQVSLQIAANATTSQRSGFVRFIQNESGNTCSIDVTQQRVNEFSVNGSSTRTVPHTASTITINLISIVNGQANHPFTVQSCPSWITATPSVATSELSLQIDTNTSFSDRIDTVVCKQTDTNETLSITITQSGDLYVLSVEPSTINVDSASHNVNIDITSERDEIPIGATITDCPPWITYNLIQ